MKRALLTVQLETQFNELIRVARMLRKSGEYESIFCFYSLTPLRFARMRKMCDQEKFDFVLFNQTEDELSDKGADIALEVDGVIEDKWVVRETKTSTNDISPIRRLRLWLRMFAPFLVTWHNWVGHFWSRRVRPFLGRVDSFRDFMRHFKGELARWNSQIIKARQLIKDQEPAIIVVGEDGIGGPVAVIKVALARRIPILVIPYEYSTMAQPAEGIISFPNHQYYYGTRNGINRVIAWLFPQWVYEYKGERLLLEASYFILAQELLGLAPRLPWVVHGGQANYIAVENKAMLRHYLKQGIPSEKLVLTGALTDDVLTANLNDMNKFSASACPQVLNRLGNKLSILCALPPDHIVTRPTCDFRSYWELLDFWIESLLALENVNVVFQLHPRVTEDEEQYIRTKGVVPIRGNAAEIIPHCDVLVTSVSSIIRLAIASKKIVVNYDVYKFDYPDYAEVDGVIVFQEKDELAAVLRRLISDNLYFAEMVARQSVCAEDWGYLDGHVADRMMQLFNRVTGG